MIKPNKEECKVRKFKTDGKNKTVTELSYIFSKGNKAFHDNLKIFREMTIHQDFFNKLQELVPIVANIEGLSDMLIYENLDGSESDKLVAQEIEGKRRTLYRNIQVTGFVISDPNGELNVVISYKKIDKGLKITGACTASVNTTKNVYGIEVELAEIATELIDEVYEYIYNDRWIDEAQLTLGLFEEPEKVASDIEAEKEKIENEGGKIIKLPKGKKSKKVVDEEPEDSENEEPDEE